MMSFDNTSSGDNIVNDLSRELLTCECEYTANVYRDLWVLYREFQIYGDCMLPTIPVIFEINTLCGLLISTLNYVFFFKFPYNFCGDFRLPLIPVKFICMLQGTLLLFDGKMLGIVFSLRL